MELELVELCRLEAARSSEELETLHTTDLKDVLASILMQCVFLSAVSWLECSLV